MPVNRTNPITGHEIVLMTPSPQAPQLFGWIRLLNEQDDAGYVYLQDAAQKGRIGSTGYIVTTIPLGEADILLTQLRADVPLQIRIAGADTEDPWVFIEPRDLPRLGTAALALPAEEHAAVIVRTA